MHRLDFIHYLASFISSISVRTSSLLSHKCMKDLHVLILDVKCI